MLAMTGILDFLIFWTCAMRFNDVAGLFRNLSRFKVVNNEDKSIAVSTSASHAHKNPLPWSRWLSAVVFLLLHQWAGWRVNCRQAPNQECNIGQQQRCFVPMPCRETWETACSTFSPVFDARDRFNNNHRAEISYLINPCLSFI